MADLAPTRSGKDAAGANYAVVPSADAATFEDHQKRRRKMYQLRDYTPILKDYARYLAEAKRAMPARQMADAFRRGLRSVEQLQITRRNLAGRLDARAMPRALAGCRDLYTTRELTPGVTTAVQIMLDASSSMFDETAIGQGQTNLWAASIAMLEAMMPALKRAGAESALAMFAGSDIPETITQVKRFGSDRGVLDLVRTCGELQPRGGTPMAAEVKWATRQLAARRTERRVCVWLCDGDPHDPTATQQQLARARRSGVEHVAVALNCSAIVDLFGPSFSVNCTDVARLPEMVAQVLLASGKASGAGR